MKKVRNGGGWPAVWYTVTKAREVGGLGKLWKALRSKNSCKTCALGMGGQKGGMVNEAGRFPEVCKKSMQAMAADMQPAIPSSFWDRYGVNELRAMSPRQLEACGRLAEPVVYRRETGRYTPLGWDEALDRVAERLADTAPDETFWYFSGRSSNEAGFLLQLFARLYGTNNVNNCSFYCHQASGVGLTSCTGSGTATIQLEDLDRADLVFLIGGNPASNHPRLMRTLMDLRRRGGKVIVINPLVETGLVRFAVPSDPWSLLFGSKIATRYVQPHIGGDLALLTGIAKHLVESGQHDSAFLSAHTSGGEKLGESLGQTSWDEITEKSGVDRQTIAAVAADYAASKGTVFAWTMGVTHHTHGVKNVQAIANLALLRGMVGRPGAGLMPIRGHSNVQGIGSVGVTPQLKRAIFERIEDQLGVELPTTAGRDTMACMEGAAAGELHAAVCLGGNLYGSNPDATFAKRSLESLRQITYLSTTLNTGHAHGLAEETMVLPVLARDEEPTPTTQESMFNYVRLSDGGEQRFAGPRSEVEIIADLATRVAEKLAGRRTALDGLDWPAMRDTGQIRAAIAKVVPGYEEIARIDQTKQEFHVGERTFHEPRFPTRDGRARLHPHELPPLAGGGGVGEGAGESDTLRVMTIRSEGQFNTVVYEDHDLYRGVDGRHVVLMHPDDLAARGLNHGDPVRVIGPAGEMRRVRATAHPEIRAGNAAMYYPEANVLVDRRVDPKSKTPAFKGLVVTLEKEAE
ncbi:MAG: FdhF/YdeP family oxidoreductase [Planctomycetota bacterium]